MRRFVLLLLIVTTAPLATALPAAASHASYAPSSFSQSRATTTWRTTGDSIYVYTNESWNSTRGQSIRNYAAQGYRYTQDMRDLHSNLNSTGTWSSNFPNPVFDIDDDDSDWRSEESEVTANSTSFPNAGASYFFDVRYSH